MSMLVAAWIYQRQYSEDMEISPNNWGVKLENLAFSLLQSIFDKTLVIPGIDVTASELSQPVFFPTDVQETDGLGSETKFAMGKVF
jgi:hypothetical protein